VHCPDDDVIEVATTDRLVALISESHFSVFAFHDLQPMNSNQNETFVAEQATVDSVGFVPRSNDSVVAYSVDAALNQAVCPLLVRSGEAPVLGTRLFDPVTASVFDPRESERVFPVPGRCGYTADASCALTVDADSFRTRDLSSSIVASLPVPDKMADVDGDNNCTTGNILLFAFSPKDNLIGLVCGDSERVIRLFDAKTPAKMVLALSDDHAGPVSDFSFLPASGHVVSYHRKSEDEETLIIWNQKSGTAVSRDTSANGVCYIRLSPASDRIALSVRRETAGSTTAVLVLRSGDNRFNVSLTTPVSWAAERSLSDAEFSPDGTVLVGLCVTSGCVWNAGSGEQLRTFDGECHSPEVVGWPTNIHVLLHDSSNERLLVYDVISDLVVASAVTEGRVEGKWSTRRFRISPRGGVVVGSTVHGELRAFICRNMASARRQTSLQAIRATTGVTSPK